MNLRDPVPLSVNSPVTPHIMTERLSQLFSSVSTPKCVVA